MTVEKRFKTLLDDPDERKRRTAISKDRCAAVFYASKRCLYRMRPSREIIRHVICMSGERACSHNALVGMPSGLTH